MRLSSWLEVHRPIVGGVLRMISFERGASNDPPLRFSPMNGGNRLMISIGEGGSLISIIGSGSASAEENYLTSCGGVSDMIRTAERGPVARRYLSDPALDKSSIWSRHWCKEPGRGA